MTSNLSNVFGKFCIDIASWNKVVEEVKEYVKHAICHNRRKRPL